MKEFMIEMYQACSNPRKILIVWITFLIGLLLFVASNNSSYPQDNKLEQAVEEAISIETGLDVDLSPKSSE